MFSQILSTARDSGIRYLSVTARHNPNRSGLVHRGIDSRSMIERHDKICPMGFALCFCP